MAEKKDKIQGDLKKPNEELALSEAEEELDKLRTREAGIRKDLADALQDGKDTVDLRKMLRDVSNDIWVVETKLQSLRNQRDGKLSAVSEAAMARKREASEIFVRKAVERIGDLEQQLEAEAKTLLCAAEIWIRNQPFKLLQVSSKKLVLVEREVLNGDSRRIEKDVVSLMSLSRAKAAGWRVLDGRTIDGEDLSLEPPNVGNSISVPAVPEPEVITRALQFGVVIDRSTITISDEDVSRLESELLHKCIEISYQLGNCLLQISVRFSFCSNF